MKASGSPTADWPWKSQQLSFRLYYLLMLFKEIEKTWCKNYIFPASHVLKLNLLIFIDKSGRLCLKKGSKNSIFDTDLAFQLCLFAGSLGAAAPNVCGASRRGRSPGRRQWPPSIQQPLWGTFFKKGLYFLLTLGQEVTQRDAPGLQIRSKKTINRLK